jgi:3'5'-cyclic nucleotide phosphodiesterase
MHSADISNTTKPRHLYLNWTQRIMDEFFLQGDKEKQLGLAISPLCDRQTVVISSSQVATSFLI